MTNYILFFRKRGRTEMANKSWSVTTDEGTYSVELKGGKISINGDTPQRITKFARKTHFVDTEYTIPLGSKSATLFMQSFASPVLAYDGRDCATGEPWQYEKIPVWGMVFLILDLVTIIWSGWIWGLLACLITAVIIRSKMSKGFKIALSVLMVIASIVAGTVVALLLAPVLYP